MNTEAEYEAAGLVCYPFPLTDGTMAYIWLPEGLLTDEDCTRIQGFLYSLVPTPIGEPGDQT